MGRRGTQTGDRADKPLKVYPLSSDSRARILAQAQRTGLSASTWAARVLDWAAREGIGERPCERKEEA